MPSPATRIFRLFRLLRGSRTAQNSVNGAPTNLRPGEMAFGDSEELLYIAKSTGALVTFNPNISGGVTGATGPQGPTGLQGATGATGPQGSSVHATGAGTASIVGIGLSNTADGAYSVVGGGAYNTVSSFYGTVSGGQSNYAGGVPAAVDISIGSPAVVTMSNHGLVGGARIRFTTTGTLPAGLDIDTDYYVLGADATADTFSVALSVNGAAVETSGEQSGVHRLNVVIMYATVGGGYDNTASAAFSAVGGGYRNTASGIYAAVSGGTYNTASGNNSTVSGGNYNIASGLRAAVLGGTNNTASGDSSTVSGGSGNTASGPDATIAGGNNNAASGNYSTVIGGANNTASGNYSSVFCGLDNSTNGQSHAHIIGSGITADAANTTFVNNLKIVGGGFDAAYIGGAITFPNSTQIAVGTFDNMTGGAGGISLHCAVGYELNWQGGRLRSVMLGDATATPQTIHCDSPMLFNAGIVPRVVPLTYGSTVNTDASTGDIFDLTLTGNATLANPTNPVDGQTIRWRITQDATGGRAVALGDKFVLPSSASSPLPFSTAANKMDVLAATYHAGRDKWDVVAFVMGY